MNKYISIVGGKPLCGSLQISGAKNSALPLMIACLLTRETCELENIPKLEDISVTSLLLRSAGAEVSINGTTAQITTKHITSTEARYGLVKALRASFLVLGPLIARAGEARVSLPGGDAIGLRPVDLHLEGLSKMGAEIRIEHGTVIGLAPGGLRPAHIVLRYPSVGATEHLMMTAAAIDGRNCD